jgi:hypothetical protein
VPETPSSEENERKFKFAPSSHIIAKRVISVTFDSIHQGLHQKQDSTFGGLDQNMGGLVERGSEADATRAGVFPSNVAHDDA